MMLNDLKDLNLTTTRSTISTAQQSNKKLLVFNQSNIIQKIDEFNILSYDSSVIFSATNLLNLTKTCYVIFTLTVQENCKINRKESYLFDRLL